MFIYYFASYQVLRYAINIKWPKKINNQKLYETTKCTKWSITISYRRLNFLGHIMRLDDNTPVRKALEEALKPAGKKRGRPKVTWLNTIIKDLSKGNIIIDINKSEETIETLTKITEDRKKWKEIIKLLIQ